MPILLETIKKLVATGDVRVSDHGYDELEKDGIDLRQAMAGVQEAMVVEDYPNYPKGPCVLVRQIEETGRYIHILWGVPKESGRPAVLVTGYRPDDRWTEDTLRRLE